MEIKNDGRLKICWMRIVGYQQFQDVFLDFTHPETGEPLDKICLIGANGTGKTVVLEMLAKALLLEESFNSFGWTDGKYIATKIIFENQPYIVCKAFRSASDKHGTFLVFEFPKGDAGYEKTLELWTDSHRLGLALGKLHNRAMPRSQREILRAKISLHSKPETLLIAAPAESLNNLGLSLLDVPETTLDESIKYGKSTNSIHSVSDERIVDFWKLLIYHTHLRRVAQDKFELSKENIEKRKIDLIAEFDGIYPKILTQISIVWNKILGKAGLEFDIENAKIPFSVDQNLYAYVKLKDSTEHIPYKELSTGIRNYIFRIGHILSLYFNQEVKQGFLLVDEPENGLFPDFLYDLVDVYRQVTTDKNGENNTQMFFATHNPIIAAQFEPYERIILEWNGDGTVRTRRGYSPIGDDPNDLLRKDFAVASLMGKEGLEAWNTYLQKKLELSKTTDEDEKERLTTEILEIGRSYNFPAR